MLDIPTYAAGQPVPTWAAQYIGIPYALGGRSMDGCDCWGLCVLVIADQFEKNPPRCEGWVWDAKTRGDIRRSVGDFMDRVASTLFDPVEPGKEEAGDVILLRISGSPLHVGIVAAPGVMLHSAEGADSALERYDGTFWKKRVMGLYRLRDDANERMLGEVWRMG